MLLTDRDPVTINDILSIDPDVAEVCSVESIPTEGDDSFVHQAVEEAASTIESYMQNFTHSYIGQQTGATSIFPLNDTNPSTRVAMGQIVVDGDNAYASPLKRWITFLALRNLYQIAANRKLDDKYEKKQKSIETDLNNKYFPAFKAAGLPVVYQPIPCPASQYERNQGTWTSANVTSVSAGTDLAADFDVAITWSKPNNIESGPSVTQTIQLLDNQRIRIDISSLVIPADVSSWKIYIGKHDGPLYFQASLPVAASSYTLTSSPILAGPLVGIGQPPDTKLAFLNLFLKA